MDLRTESLNFSTFQLFICLFLTADIPSPHGTRGQKVRHFPVGSSDLIHGYFYPLGRMREHIILFSSIWHSIRT